MRLHGAACPSAPPGPSFVLLRATQSGADAAPARARTRTRTRTHPRAHTRAHTQTPSGVAGTYSPLLSRQAPFGSTSSYPAAVGRVSAAMVAQHTTTTSIRAGGCTYTPKCTHTHTYTNTRARARPGRARRVMHAHIRYQAAARYAYRRAAAYTILSVPASTSIPGNGQRRAWWSVQMLAAGAVTARMRAVR